MEVFYKIKQKVTGLLMIVMLFSGLVISGQEVTVSAMLDTTRAMIGDQLKLHLRVETTPTTSVVFPSLHDTLAGKIEIVKRGAIDTVLNQPGRILLNQDLLLTVFDTGFFEIPRLAFAFKAGRLQDTVHSMPVNFEILSMPMDTTIRDIRANMKAPVNLAEVLPFALGLMGLVLITFLIIYWIRKRKKKTPGILSKISSEPADEIAIRELEQLRKESWVQKQIKLYYIRLTEILRVYIERRYDIMALEQTTDEILHAIRKSIGSDSDLKRLASILKLADLVKFAKVIPGQQENDLQLDEAVLFVKNTARPKEELNKEIANEHDPVQNIVES